MYIDPESQMFSEEVRWAWGVLERLYTPFDTIPPHPYPPYLVERDLAILAEVGKLGAAVAEQRDRMLMKILKPEENG